MSQTTKLITGMGAALVDLFAHVSEAKLAALGSPKASMSLVEPARSDEMQKAVHVHESQPGGSIANSIAGIAALGMASGFIGKIGDDALGAVFTDAFTRANVRFPVTPMDALPTGHCLGFGHTRCRAHHAYGVGRVGDNRHRRYRRRASGRYLACYLARAIYGTAPARAPRFWPPPMACTKPVAKWRFR
jgi:hypothetical protein